MAAPQDYDLDENNDMYIGPDGDWVVDDSNEVDISLILVTSPGSWKQNPTIGMGIQGVQNAALDTPTIDQIESNLKVQLLANGFDVNGVKLFISNGNIADIQINADRQI